MSQDIVKNSKCLIDEIEELQRKVTNLTKQTNGDFTFPTRDRQHCRAEEIARIGSFVVELSTGDMKWSDQVYRMLGLKPGEINASDKSFGQFVHPDDRDRLTEESKKVYAGKADLNIVYRIIRKDGQLRNVHTQTDSEFDENGNLTYIWGYSQDISERKFAEEKGKEYEIRNESLLQKSPVCTKVVDPDYNLKFMSAAGVKALGVEDVNELYGKRYPFDFLSESFQAKMTAKMDEAQASGDTQTLEAPINDAAGNQIWFHATIVPVFDTEGNIDYFLILSINTSERVKTEVALKESERRFRALADASHEGVGISHAGIIIDANNQMADMLGYSLDEIIGLPVSKLVAPESLTKVEQHLKSGVDSAYEHLALKKDGSKILVEVRGMKTMYDGKQVRVTAIRDITETKRLQELESRAERLETAGTIAGQVAHDFNNLLAPLMAYPDFIREELAEDHPALPYVDDLESAAKKIAEINQELLTLSRRGFYTKEALDLNKIIRHSVKESQSHNSTIVYNTDLSQDLFPIKGGNAQIHRILNNLLKNASDAMQNIGQVTVKTENYYADDTAVCYGRVPKGEYVKLTVTDNGCGIPEEIVHKILDPFFTTKSTDRQRGSGLGLSVVDSVMKDHDGYIDLSSTIGQGTSFYLYFPVSRDCINTEGQEEADIYGTESILIIDDDQIQRKVSSEILERLGYNVTTVESGEKAVELLKGTSYDLLILDMIMPPGIDGAETYRQILKSNPDQRAIIVSGYAESDRAAEAQKLGAGAFIKKPLSKNVIGTAVRTELERHSQKSMS